MKFFKYLLLGILGLATLLLIWGVAIEPYLIDTEAHEVEISGLSSTWNGQHIAVMSDWQVGMWLDNTSTIRRIVERLVAERPAAVLIAGDFTYYPDDDRGEESLGKVLDLLRPLPEAGIPTFAVLGNHDYGMPEPTAPMNAEWVEVVRNALENLGIAVLTNEAVALTPPADDTAPANAPEAQMPLYLVGIGAHWPGMDKPEIALAQVPAEAPRIVFMHHPDSFAALPAGTAPLAVAGHTHGGQVRLPFTPDWSWLAWVEEDEVHVDGWIQGYGQPGNRLYVNRGIGFSILPIRINCPPEITLFTLRAGG